ncbi:homocysteine S-methyltransferase [Amycolatopsis thermophila]|uniref:Homocysteine S-methyltransferase n=1 Tax=Amycolatopsis thermophila TaxID=206084 RepID=A0ABU0F2V6_9PSEU|nr:homocysteine S-methyltransferase [Amycolatopsis thermophila]MDQ0381915.1 homocysteine S-methyltransferase [Amycolatopsis thermophila]
MTVVLDGGLATELEARGHDLSDALWSARLLADDPAEIVAAHRAFFRAGARVATTASYQASFAGFAEAGLDRGEAVRLLEVSVELAREARTDPGQLVAASIGPYGATLADGSEYRGHYGLSVAELAAFHRPRAEVLAAAGPDLLACETVPDVDEAEAMLLAIEGLGVPAWLSYTIDGEATRGGQPLTEAFAVARGNDQVVAVGVNCCDPRDVAAAVTIAREASGKPVIAYPNSGENWDARARRWAGSSRFAPALVRDWLDAGASWVGGCCRVGPGDIAALAAVVSPPAAGSPPG